MTFEQLLGVPILLALGWATWALWRDSMVPGRLVPKWHLRVMAGIVGALMVCSGWYWVGLFAAKM